VRRWPAARGLRRGAPEQINGKSEQPLRHALELMDGAELACIASDVPERLLIERPALLLHEDRHRVRESRRYGEGTVGSPMGRDWVFVNAAAPRGWPPCFRCKCPLQKLPGRFCIRPFCTHPIPEIGISLLVCH